MKDTAIPERKVASEIRQMAEMQAASSKPPPPSPPPSPPLAEQLPSRKSATPAAALPEVTEALHATVHAAGPTGLQRLGRLHLDGLRPAAGLPEADDTAADDTAADDTEADDTAADDSAVIRDVVGRLALQGALWHAGLEARPQQGQQMAVNSASTIQVAEAHHHVYPTISHTATLQPYTSKAAHQEALPTTGELPHWWAPDQSHDKSHACTCIVMLSVSLVSLCVVYYMMLA